MIRLKDILGNGITATKAVEQPTVQVLLKECRLNSFGDRSFHGS
jgi:hypothetical protein